MAFGLPWRAAIEKNFNLDHNEIIYLCTIAHQAYIIQSHRRKIINSNYLLDCLGALEEVLKLFINSIEFEVERFLPREYYLSANASHVNPFDIIAEKKRNIDKFSIDQAGEIAGALAGIVSEEDFQQLSIINLNEVLQPFKFTLLTLCKKYNFDRTKEPLFHYLDYSLFAHDIFIKPAKSDFEPVELFNGAKCSIQIICDINFSGVISLKDFTISFNFPLFNDLLNNFLYRKKSDIQNKTEHFQLSYLKDDNTHWLAHKNINLYLQEEDLNDLRSLVFIVADKYQYAFKHLRYQWGDI